MDRAIVIANPKAGMKLRSGRALRLLKKELLKRSIPFSVFEKAEMIPTATLQLAKTTVIVLGGDGTLNFVANYLFARNISLPIGIIPIGSANIFAQAIGVPLTIRRAINNIFTGRIRESSVGLANNKTVFLVGVTTGAHAELMDRTSRKIKVMLGSIAYYLKLFFRLLIVRRYRHQLRFDDKTPLEVEASAVFVLNALPKLFGGSYNTISAFDNKLYTLVVKSASPFEIARAFNEMYVWRKKPVHGVYYYESDTVHLQTDKATVCIDAETVSQKSFAIAVTSFFSFIVPNK